MHTDKAKAPPSAGRRARLAWYAYDLGNTAVEFAIPLYLTLWIVNDLGVKAWVYGLASALSSWAIGLSGPYIGVSADDRRKRKQWFVFAAITSAVLLISLGLLPNRGTTEIVAILVVAMMANYLFQLSSLIYNASLLGASGTTNIISVSSIGIAFSFLGGIVGVGIIELIVSGRLIPGVDGRGVAMVPAALIYLACALPSMFTPALWQKPDGAPPVPRQSLRRRVSTLWAEASRERHAGWFLGGYFALNSAVMGLTLYLPLHVETVTDLGGWRILAIYGVVVIASAAGAGAVALMRPQGAMVRRIILVGLSLLAANTFVSAVARSLPLIIICTCLHGLFSGGLVPTCRGAFALTFHSDHQALAFGLYGAVQRVSQGLGALLWPLAGAGGGSYATRLGVAAMGILALLGVPFFSRWSFVTAGTEGGQGLQPEEQAH